MKRMKKTLDPSQDFCGVFLMRRQLTEITAEIKATAYDWAEMCEVKGKGSKSQGEQRKRETSQDVNLPR